MKLLQWSEVWCGTNMKCLRLIRCGLWNLWLKESWVMNWKGAEYTADVYIMHSIQHLIYNSTFMIKIYISAKLSNNPIIFKGFYEFCQLTQDACTPGHWEKPTDSAIPAETHKHRTALCTVGIKSPLQHCIFDVKESSQRRFATMHLQSAPRFTIEKNNS